MAKILLTEDDDGIRNFLAHALQMDGHEVALAEDGEDVLINCGWHRVILTFC